MHLTCERTLLKAVYRTNSLKGETGQKSLACQERPGQDGGKWLGRVKRGELWCRRGLEGGGGVLPPSGFLLESLFRCQSPEGIRKLCWLPLIFSPQHAASPSPRSPSDQCCISVGITAPHLAAALKTALRIATLGSTYESNPCNINSCFLFSIFSRKMRLSIVLRQKEQVFEVRWC